MDIYTCTPINKQTATIIGQSGCTSHAGYSLDQQRNILLARKKYLESERKKDNPKQIYDSLGKEIFKINTELEKIIAEIKKNRHDKTITSDNIIRVCKSKSSEADWGRILEEARDLGEE